MPVVVMADTNVWFSALINPHGPPAILKQAWLDGGFVPVMSEPMIAELARAKFAVSRDDDLKRDQDLVAHMKAQGVEVLSLRQFLERLANNALE